MKRIGQILFTFGAVIGLSGIACGQAKHTVTTATVTAKLIRRDVNFHFGPIALIRHSGEDIPTLLLKSGPPEKADWYSISIPPAIAIHNDHGDTRHISLALESAGMRAADSSGTDLMKGNNGWIVLPERSPALPAGFYHGELTVSMQYE